MNFKELISKRRACKLFNDKKINEKDLHFILESGVLAPSSHGFEPWKFVVLEQKEHNLKLSTLCYKGNYEKNYFDFYLFFCFKFECKRFGCRNGAWISAF